MKDKLKFITDGANTRRYHTVPTLLTETVGHHSHGVAMIAVLLSQSKEISEVFDIICASMLHDLAEHQTGDIPSPAKRQFGIGDQVNDLEEVLLKSAGLEMPNLNPRQARILKLADIAQGALFCLQEIEMGNRKMTQVYDRYMSYAEDMILVGVEKELFQAIKEMAK